MSSPGAGGVADLDVARWFADSSVYRGRLVQVDKNSDAPPGCDMAYFPATASLASQHQQKQDDTNTLDTTLAYFQSMASPNARVIVDGCHGAVKRSYDNAISIGLIEHERHVR